MLSVTRAQVEALAGHARRHFERRLLEHLRPHFPALFAALGDEEMRVVVEEGARRAEDHRLAAERDVCGYVELMCALGWDFDEEPWAASILRGEGDRIALLREAAEDRPGAAALTPPDAGFRSMRVGDPCARPRNPE